MNKDQGDSQVRVMCGVDLNSFTFGSCMFVGFTGNDEINRKTGELTAWLECKRMEALGNPGLARDNPSWTLPFHCRKEIIGRY